MEFTTQIVRASSPTVTIPVKVALTRLYWMERNREGAPIQLFEFEVAVFSDIDSDGTPDTVLQISATDFLKRYTANEAQNAAVYDRLRGAGNLMAGIRAFCKSRVLENNPAATFVDLDDDLPI